MWTPAHPTPVNSRRPNQNIGDVSFVKAIDQSNYHSLEVKLNKRFSNGLSVIGAYTYSKAMGIGGALSGDQSRRRMTIIARRNTRHWSSIRNIASR